MKRVENADQQQLILMLYEAVIRCLGAGQEAIKAKDHQRAHNLLYRSQNIILELIEGLN